ncbi:hypothetical protein B0H14DRAFT_2986011, partial [Mycena olivaceomarginata]
MLSATQLSHLIPVSASTSANDVLPIWNGSPWTTWSFETVARLICRRWTSSSAVVPLFTRPTPVRRQFSSRTLTWSTMVVFLGSPVSTGVKTAEAVRVSDRTNSTRASISDASSSNFHRCGKMVLETNSCCSWTASYEPEVRRGARALRSTFIQACKYVLAFSLHSESAMYEYRTL